MFRVPWIERYLSRVRPWQVVVVWAPVSLYCLARGFHALSPLAALGTMLTGVLTWTLLEYTLHRFAFHFAPSPRSELQQDLSFLIHGVHHDYPMDPDRLVMPPVISLVLSVLIGVPAFLMVGPQHFWSFFGGLTAGYLWYDLTHYATHHFKPRTAWGRAQKAHHMLHHFQTPELRFGITTPLWDYVFGTHTLPKPSKRGERQPERA